MKLMKENSFSNRLARMKKWLSGVSFETIIGKIEKFFFIVEEYEDDVEFEDDDYETDYEYEDDDYDYEEDGQVVQDFNGAVYHLALHDVSEYEFALNLIKAGYLVIITTTMLDENAKEQFRRKLQVELFKLGIYCDSIDSERLVIAPTSVEVMRSEEPKQEKGQILYLSNYKKK